MTEKLCEALDNDLLLDDCKHLTVCFTAYFGKEKEVVCHSSGQISHQVKREDVSFISRAPFNNI